MLKIIIDGKELAAKRGQTILEVASENGIHIPTLCYDERLKPYGGCGICVVEVQGSSKLFRSCATEVTEGMVVFTNTPRVRKSRKLTLEMLLSDHTGDCLGPCTRACPAHVDVQGYIGLIANRRYREAVALIKERLPIPASIGRICPHPCEDACRRQLVEAPISIAHLKRFVADLDLKSGEPYRPEIRPATGKSVGIVGAGPAGLTAAYHLARDGHGVTVYDAMPQGGGMLRYGIPAYRLPKTVLDEEIRLIAEMGVRFCYNTRLGSDISIDLLRKRHDAIFLAIGAWKSSSIRCPGENIPGVLGGIDFLREVALHGKAEIGNVVAVIGGGNTAIDAARTAVRLGAERVLILYRRTKAEMPAEDKEIAEAEEEGVEFRFLVSPMEICARNGRVCAIRLQKMQLGEPDATGRRRPVPIPGAEETLPVDTVIRAIGQSVRPDGLACFSLTKWGTIAVDENTMATEIPGVFAGGDVVTGPSIAIEAVAQGIKAAHAISAYLNGRILSPKNQYVVERQGLSEAEFIDHPRINRAEMPHLTPEERRYNFREVNLGLQEPDAQVEASRCLECGCRDYFECKLIRYAREYNVQPERLSGSKHREITSQDDHPFLELNSGKCILCGLCVRICDEVMGVTALGLVHRGFDTVVAPEFGLPLRESACVSCGQCAAVCPTGALMERQAIPKNVPLATQENPSVCPFCGAGCEQVVNTRGDLVFRCLPAPGGILCVKGRFGFQIFDQERLTVPLVRHNGKLVEVSWQEAMDEIAKTVKRIGTGRRDSPFALFISPFCTMEEAQAAICFGRQALVTEKIGSFTPDAARGLMDIFGIIPDPPGYQELESADLILLVGSLNESQSVAVKIRKAIQRGARLALLSPEPGLAGDLATMWVKPGNSGNSTAFLKQVLAAVVNNTPATGRVLKGFTELRDALAGITPGRDAEDLAHLYSSAKQPLIVVDGSTVTTAAVQLLADLSLVTGQTGRFRSGLLIITPGSNQVGLRKLGIVTGDSLLEEKPHGVFIFGEDPVGGGSPASGQLKNMEFLVVLSPFLTPTARLADVVLPGATPLETGGTFIGSDGRERSFSGVRDPLSGRTNLQIISDLAAALGVERLPGRGESVRFSVNSVTPHQREGEIRLVLPEDTELFRLQPELDPALRIFKARLVRSGLK